MKLQTLLSSAALLLTAVPALAEEPVRAVAQPIEAFEDVIVSAGLYDSEDDEEDSYDMEDVAKKDSKKSDKKSKKSNRRKNRNRRSNRNNRRRRRKGMCRNPKGRSDRDLCDELEDRFCSGSRRNKQNRQLCHDLGFRRSVTDEEWALIDTEEFLPEEYDMLIDDVAEDIDDSSMNSEDEDESYDMDSEDSEDSYDYDDEEDSGDEEDSEDIDLKEKGKGGGKKTSKKKTSKKKTSKKKDSKKKKSNKKSKKSNKRSNKRSSRSSSSSSRSSRSCFDRSHRSSCEDTSRCEWFKTSTGGFCIEASSSSSDYDFAEE